VNWRKRLILTIGSAAIVLVVVRLIVGLEPFAPRYQGKTVNQWLAFYAASEGSEVPTDDVIQAFGTNALPILISAETRPLWRDKIEDAIQRFALKAGDFLIPVSPSRPVCVRQWAVLWARLNHATEAEILEHNNDDKFVSDLFELTRGNEMSRLEAYAVGKDEVLRERAIKLLRRQTNFAESNFQR
jgi:hypothetical protein